MVLHTALVLQALVGLATAADVVPRQAGLLPPKFRTLPLGAVRPYGWLQDQLMVQTNGLAGHEHEFYNYVSQTDWMGGSSYYSALEEAGSYWFNAMVPNAFLANNAALKARVQAFADYVISHQQTDGWLGPETGNKPKYLWGRYPFFFGLIQLSEADPSQTTKIVDAMYRFVPVANAMLRNGTGTEAWTNTRWQDFVMSLQWLHEFYPRNATTQTLLIDTMTRVRARGVNWKSVCQPSIFPKTSTDGMSNPNPVLTWHGVNFAEGLKSGAASWRYTQDPTDLAYASECWDLAFQYHGRPSGVYTADEYLAGLTATRGTELCIVVEIMYSGSYLYQVIGDPKFADRVERIAYNALPTTLTGDMWSHQYVQAQNQIASRNMTPNPFGSVVNGYSNVFGLEPNYPCCTVNFPQGWPKFITNAFMTTVDRASLVQVYLGPFNTTYTLANSNAVNVVVDTLYPFSDTLTTTITATRAFDYYVRVPSWVKRAGGGTIAINGGSPVALSPDATTSLQRVPAAAGRTTFILNYPANIETEARPNNAVAIHRGPLHYASDIARNQTVLKRHATESRAVDLQFLPTSSWAFAIDPATAVFSSRPPSTGRLPSPVFDSRLPPLSINVTACPITWNLGGTTFPTAPPQNPACTGSRTTLTLWPYGSTRLHISEFPRLRAT